jgi:hypothetical protein
VPVEGLSVERQFWLVSRTRRTPSPAARVFTALMQESFGSA